MLHSLQLYTVRNSLERDLSGTIAKVAALGLVHVEPYNFETMTDELVDAMSKYGITAPSGHTRLQDADLDEIFAAANKLGIKTVIEAYIPPEQWQNKEDIRKNALRLNAAAKKAAHYGVRIGYHNHYWELESKIDGVTALEFFGTLLDPEVVLEVDVYWVSVGGENAAEVLRRLGKRVKFIHIKDGPMNRDTKAQVPAGQGDLAIWDIIDAAESLEVGIIEFDDYAGEIFDGVAASLAFLNAGKV